MARTRQCFHADRRSLLAARYFGAKFSAAPLMQ
jgi:hypothetical protein